MPLPEKTSSEKTWTVQKAPENQTQYTRKSWMRKTGGTNVNVIKQSKYFNYLIRFLN